MYGQTFIENGFTKQFFRVLQENKIKFQLYLIDSYLYFNLHFFSLIGNLSKFSPKCTWLKCGHNCNSFKNRRETINIRFWKTFLQVCFLE